MKKVFEWFSSSHRWKHLVGGVIVGIGADTTYCAAYTGLIVASALEYKDKAHGGKWDWIDFGLTIAGVIVGHLIRKSL